MNGKESIINSILNKASGIAASIVSDALAASKESLEQCQAELDSRKVSLILAAQDNAKELIRRKLTIAQLDARKITLRAKQNVIGEVYKAAITKMNNMTDNIYREFIFGLLKVYAENGDKVVICSRDTKRLTGSWLVEMSGKLDKDLSLGTYFHEGNGGIVLVNNKYDKKLTINTIVDEIRPLTEAKVIKKLFKN